MSPAAEVECKVCQKWPGDASITLGEMPRTLWSVAEGLSLETGLRGCRFENGAGMRHKERISRRDVTALEEIEKNIRKSVWI